MDTFLYALNTLGTICLAITVVLLVFHGSPVIRQELISAMKSFLKQKRK